MSSDFARMQAQHMMQCWSSQRGYDPLPVKSADGCWITTVDGRRIFDLRSAHECINLGFRHPTVLAAMRAQMESVIYVTDDFATEPTGRLARRLAELVPGPPNKKVYFSQSGAAAIEAAIKGARQPNTSRPSRAAPTASTRRSSTRFHIRSSHATARGTARPPRLPPLVATRAGGFSSL